MSPLHRIAPLAALFLASCGWRSGLPSPAGVRTVGIEVARRGDAVLERGLEERFTDALSKRISDWVDLRIAAPAEADLVVRSKVLEYRRRRGVRSLDNELVETAVLVRVEASLVDRRTHTVVAGPVQAGQWSGYALDPSDPGVEEAAADRALRHAAETLVLDLFDPASTRRPERDAFLEAE